MQVLRMINSSVSDADESKTFIAIVVDDILSHHLARKQSRN